jgi:formylglycine-generating enzyme required for sulfatase activity
MKNTKTLGLILLLCPALIIGCESSGSRAEVVDKIESGTTKPEINVPTTKSPISIPNTTTVTPTKTTVTLPKTTVTRPPIRPPMRGNLKEGEDFINSLGMKFVWINPGSFMMGEGTDHDAERPVHKVTIKNGFWMSAYEMTQGQYEKLTGKNPSDVKGENLPVTKVNFVDAFNLCSMLTGFESMAQKLPTGNVYLLPSEAQWEYACRAGTRTVTYAEPVDDIAWHQGNSDKKPHPVGLKKPNVWGLYDMLGNVAEWCEDGWHHGYKGCPDDETPWTKDMVRGERIGRGGHFDEHAHFSSAYYRRDFGYIQHATNYRGLRFVVMKRGQRK